MTLTYNTEITVNNQILRSVRRARMFIHAHGHRTRTTYSRNRGQFVSAESYSPTQNTVHTQRKRSSLLRHLSLSQIARISSTSRTRHCQTQHTNKHPNIQTRTRTALGHTGTHASQSTARTNVTMYTQIHVAKKTNTARLIGKLNTPKTKKTRRACCLPAGFDSLPYYQFDDSRYYCSYC